MSRENPSQTPLSMPGEDQPDEEALLKAALNGEFLVSMRQEAQRFLDLETQHQNEAWRIAHLVHEHQKPEQEPERIPVLAALLAQGLGDRVHEHEAELWWDRALQHAAREKKSPQDLARIALNAPARTLARSPKRWLQMMHASEPAAYKRLSEALYPAPISKKRSPQELRAQLHTSSLVSERCQALEELLSHIEARPFEIFAGVEINLRLELAAFVAEALENTPPTPKNTPFYYWEQLEALCLRHAALIVYANGDTSTKHAWDIGQWMARVLRESPFLGADPEILSAELDSILPDVIPGADDPRWPAEIGFGSEQIRLQDILVMEALQNARDKWELPGPLLEPLRKIAGRTLKDGERRALRKMADSDSEASYAMAPPMCARLLVHAAKAPWLSRIPEAAHSETLNCLREYPHRYAWVMVALYREASSLHTLALRSSFIFKECLGKHEALLHSSPSMLGPFCLWASTLMASLDEEQSHAVMKLALQTEAQWRVGVLLAFANGWAANPWMAKKAMDALVHLLRSATELSLRVPAARAAIRAAATYGDIAQQQTLMNRIIESLSPDLKSHPDIRLELKRAGRAL